MDYINDTFVWLIGSEGMLGKELYHQFQESGIPFESTDVDCDITNLKKLRTFSRGKVFTHIINCAAYTNVDKAEDDYDNAYALNAIGPRNVALIASELDAVIIHLSTDYVFDGIKTRGYLEDDPVNPISIYGKTKAIGEHLIQEIFSTKCGMNDFSKKQTNSNCLQNAGNTFGFYIVRTSWLYGKYGKNFVNTMLQLLNEKNRIRVINDQHGSPTSASTLATFIIYLIIKREPWGIYHYTNDGQTTWYDFSLEIYRLGLLNEMITSECSIEPVDSKHYKTKAKRPKYSKLLRSKNNVYSVSWEEALEDFLFSLK
jgi:dTDP-4-dehydrorhamnose reductase